MSEQDLQPRGRSPQMWIVGTEPGVRGEAGASVGTRERATLEAQGCWQDSVPRVHYLDQVG